MDDDVISDQYGVPTMTRVTSKQGDKRSNDRHTFTQMGEADMKINKIKYE